MTEVLVAGGGLAGGAAATLLARSGRSVRLIERNAEPKDKMCGEFLSIEGQRHLESLGIDLAGMGAAPISHVRLVSGGLTLETRLPFIACGISRRRLDEALLSLAEHAGAQVERGIRILEIGPDCVRTSNGERRAEILMLATGKLPVRETARVEEKPVRDAHVGFKMHWRTTANIRKQLEGYIELLLFPGGYAGLQMVEGGIANLCLVIRRSQLTALGGRWQDVIAAIGRLSPALSACIDAEPLFERPLTVANLAYGRMARAQTDSPIFRLGDQAAMTASLTGDGMAIALRSAWLAVRLFLSGRTATEYHDALKKMVGPQVKRGMLLQRGTEMPLLRQTGLGLLRIHPGLLRHIVTMTRLPDLPPDLIEGNRC